MAVALLSCFVDSRYVADTPDRFSWMCGALRKQGGGEDGCYEYTISIHGGEGDLVVEQIFRYFIDRTNDGTYYLAYSPWEMCNYFSKLAMVAPIVFFGMLGVYLVQIALVLVKFAYQSLRRAWQDVDGLRESFPDVYGLIKCVVGVEIAALYALTHPFDSRRGAQMQVVISQLDRQWNNGVPFEETLPHLARRCAEICRQRFLQSQNINVLGIWKELDLEKRGCFFYLCADFQPIDRARVHPLENRAAYSSYSEMDAAIEQQTQRVIEGERERVEPENPEAVGGSGGTER